MPESSRTGSVDEAAGERADAAEDGSDAPHDEPAHTSRFPVGMRYMVAGAFFFSVMSLLVKLAGERIPSQQVVLARAVVTLVLSAWAVRHARVSPWGNRGRRRLLLFRGVMGFVALSCFYYTLTNLPLADSTVIQYTNPVWAGLLAVPLLGERLRMREVVSVLASLAGVVVVTRPSFLFGGQAAALPPGVVAIGLLGAVCSGVAYVTVRKLGGTEHASVIIVWFAAVSVVGSLPLVRDPVWPTPAEWLVLLGVGVFTQLGQMAITVGLRLERAGRATATGYLQIVFAAAWGIAFFGEIPDAATLAGALLIVASTLALARRRTGGRRVSRRAAG